MLSQESNTALHKTKCQVVETQLGLTWFLIFSFRYPDWYPTTLGVSCDGLASLMCVTSPTEGRKGTANFSALEWNV